MNFVNIFSKYTYISRYIYIYLCISRLHITYITFRYGSGCSKWWSHPSQNGRLEDCACPNVWSQTHILILSNTHMIKCHTSCCCLVSSLPSLESCSSFHVRCCSHPVAALFKEARCWWFKGRVFPLADTRTGILNEAHESHFLCRMMAILRVSDILPKRPEIKGF